MTISPSPYQFGVSKELDYYDQIHQEKCRDTNQSFIEHARNISLRIGNNGSHSERLYEILLNKRFLPAGRVQAALGAREREVSPFNCAVSQVIEDSMESIMDAASKAAMILRLGTGIGYNFSKLRPKGDLIKKLQTEASGPVSFMEIFDVVAKTIASSGHRRGAQMGILNVDHPDIERFIDAKLQKGALRQFNISVGVTDNFMRALKEDVLFPLQFGGKVYREISAKALWDKMLRNAYESAEPGIIFIDRLNTSNNLHYCERIDATNPCAEQPLPPYGLCCLGSFNLPAYLDGRNFNIELFKKDIKDVVRAYDNIFDDANYAIPEHGSEAKSKRRIGLGFTGIASCIEYMVGSACYGSPQFCSILDYLAATLTHTAYSESVALARERGPFKLYDKRYLESKFIKSLDPSIQEEISKYGIRNSHLISYAPCGTISMYAGNVSSGVEPVFYHSINRDIYMRNGLENVTLSDYNYRKHNFEGKTLEECTIEEHLNVAKVVAKHTDSAVSKTINVAGSISFEDYKTVYEQAYDAGLKGITVFRPTDLRGAVITEAKAAANTAKPKPVLLEAMPKIRECRSGVCEL